MRWRRDCCQAIFTLRSLEQSVRFDYAWRPVDVAAHGRSVRQMTGRDSRKSSKGPENIGRHFIDYGAVRTPRIGDASIMTTLSQPPRVT